jgi:hypothetical protein
MRLDPTLLHSITPYYQSANPQSARVTSIVATCSLSLSKWE